MGAPPEDEYAMRLEGRAALLAPARERYYRLVLVLAESRWQERLRQELEQVREVASHQAQVDALLDPAVRRAEAEQWPAHHPTVRSLLEVRSLRDQLARDVARKLGRNARESLSVLLGALEEWLITLPRVVPAHLRESTALELLPATLPALGEAAAFGERLEPLFSSPLLLTPRLPFSGRQREELIQGWSRGEEALASLWRRLSGVDAQGFMVADLRERARHAPRRPPENALERLLHAEHWYQQARNLLGHMARTRMLPLKLEPGETLPVMWWLLEREYAPRVRLVPSATLEDARAGLLELAYELWDAQRPDIAEEERCPAARWGRMVEHARRVDASRRVAEADKLRDALREFIGRYSLGTQHQRGWRSPNDLVSLVEQAREVVT